LGVFPNPASDVVSVTYPEDFVEGNIRVQDALGRVVLSKTLDSEGALFQMNVDGWISGVYQINLVDANSSRTLNRRLVVR
jgi:hypothetical protein